MIRGRHRALPVAIDRAIMLPHEFEKPEEERRRQTVDFSNDAVETEKKSAEKRGGEGSTHRDPETVRLAGGLIV